MDEYYQVVQTLPQWLARPLGQLPSEDAETVHELRLRLGCAPRFTVQGCSCTPTQLAPELNALQTMQLTPLQMEEILFTLCGGSVHTHQTEIAQGYVTLENGCRAGLGGRFLQNPEQGTVLQELTSVNLRIAREKTVPLPQELTAALRGHFIGMLLVGEPGSGKTTLLRSIARELVRQQKILSVIDERRELFAGNIHGEALDVLAGLPKGQAVQMALRSLSPQVILLDEPFTGVDVQTEARIISLLRELRDEGCTMLVSTHNLGSVSEFCDYTVMVKGTVLASGPTETTFTAENLERAFSGVLRHVALTGAEAQVITDDERPFISRRAAGGPR